MNTDLLLRVQQIDPAPPDDAIPDGLWNAQQVLEELHRRTDTPIPQRPRTYRRWLIATAVAAAVLVLIGGFGLLTRGQNDTDESPVVNQVEPEESPIVDPVEPEESPIVEPEEPTVDGDGEGEAPWSTEDLPQGAESGTLATPLGAASWVRLSSDEGKLPDSGQAIPWLSGFVIFQDARLWISDDGIEWRGEPLPLDPATEDATLTLVDGVYWLMSSDPSGLWRSNDGATWNEYDPTGLLPSGPSGLFWLTYYTPPVTAGELRLSYATSEANFPFHEYLPLLIDDYEPSSDRDEGCRTFRKLESGVFQIVGHQGDQPCPHELALRFEKTETGLRVRNNATGTDLGEILGADLSHIEQLTQGGDIFEKRALIIGDSEITPVEVPWTGWVDALFGAREWIYAYVRDQTGMTVWRTSDGRSWTDLGPPGFLEGTTDTNFIGWHPLAGSLVATLSRPDTGIVNCASRGLRCLELVAAWEATDGITWSPDPRPEGRPDQSHPVRLESGWFANDGSKRDNSEGDWWMHVGDTWVSLAELGLDEGRCEGVFPTAVENTAFFFGRDCPDLWILSLNPSS